MKKGKSAYKILVVSDSHGSDTGIRQAIKQEGEDIDVLVHCGDMGHDIKASLGLDYRFDIYSVTGNCDYLLPQIPEVSFKLGYFNFLVIHGHLLDVKYSNDRIIAYAKENYADIVLFGHSHIPEIEERFGVLLVNPGSISLPRQFSRNKTYAVVTITDDSLPKAVIREIEE